MKTTQRRASTKRRTRILASAAVLGVATLVVPAVAIAHGSSDPHADRTAAVRKAIVPPPAKNVILLIGDGMGDSEITIARNYQYGAGGHLPGIDALPLTGDYTTYSIYKNGPYQGKPDYDPDSAATASAWSTGIKTYDSAISVDIDGQPHQTLLEIAKANGLKTGDVSTAEIQDATPAAQVAHVAVRSCYGPDTATCGDDALAAGGLGSISEQLLNTRPDVTLGGGQTTFLQTAKAGAWEGETLFAQAEDRGYQVVQDAAGLASVTTANQTSPVLGLFTPGNFPTRYAPTTATVGGADGTPVTCSANPDRLSTDLSLSALTTKAISLLTTSKKSAKGFFLQVEGASIDKRDHAADACGQIGETIDFDEAVQVALAYAKKDRNTLVLVTADHAHSSQIVDSAPPATLSTALATTEGSVLKVAYGTAAAGASQQHTGTQLRIAGYGPGAANVVGLTDQTDNFYTIANSLALNRDTARLSSHARAAVDHAVVLAGATVTVSASRFAGDRQALGSMGTTALGSSDVINGAARFTFTPPTTPGRYSVTVTGAQSGKAVSVKFTVR